MVDFCHEHGKGPGVGFVVAVEGLVDHEFFFCFGVCGNTDDLVEICVACAVQFTLEVPDDSSGLGDLSGVCFLFIGVVVVSTIPVLEIVCGSPVDQVYCHVVVLTHEPVVVISQDQVFVLMAVEIACDGSGLHGLYKSLVEDLVLLR